MIKLMIVDDDKEWIGIIRSILECDNEIEILTSVSSGEEAIKFIKNCDDIDMVLMDVDLSGDSYDGVRLTSEILDIRPVKVIMLTCAERRDVVSKAFFAGAVNYLYKRDITMLIHTIKSSFSGASPFMLLGNKTNEISNELKKHKVMNRSERDLYDLKLAGYSISQIAEKLSKSVSTIKSQLNNIYKKFEVKDFESLKSKINDMDE